MTREEAITKIFKEYGVPTSNPFFFDVIKALEQKPCVDAISRQAVLKTISELNAISFYEAQEDSKECYYEIRQAIENEPPVTLKGTKAFCEIRYDKDELERLVYEAKEEIKKGIIAIIIDDLNEIHEKLWNIKISAPNIIEHREHYKQLQDVTAVVSEKLKKWQEEESEEEA